jgi:hypothetical protein
MNILTSIMDALCRHTRAVQYSLILGTATLLVGCATTAPVLLSPNARSAQSSSQSEAAIAACREAADRDVGRNAMNAPKVARKLGKAGATEFAETVVEKSVRNSSAALRNASAAAAGGVAGLATKLVFEWNEPDRVYQKHVEHCLERRGHRVLGWR